MPKKRLSSDRLIGEGDPTNTNGARVRKDDSLSERKSDSQESTTVKALRGLSDVSLRETVKCAVQGVEFLSPANPNTPLLTPPGGLSYFSN